MTNTLKVRRKVSDVIWLQSPMSKAKASELANKIVDQLEYDKALKEPDREGETKIELIEAGEYAYITLNNGDGTKKWIKVVGLRKWMEGDVPPAKDGVYQDPVRPHVIFTRRFTQWTSNVHGGVAMQDLPQGLVLLAEFPA